MAARLQVVYDDGDPCVVTIATPDAVGNLLLAVVCERSGTTEANHTVSDDGTAWTKIVGKDEDLLDSTYRFSASLWYKFSDAGQDETISMDDGTGNTKWGFVAEYELEGTEEWGDVLGENATSVQNVGTEESLNSGNTDAVAGDDFFVFSVAGLKNGASNNLAMDFDNGINDNFNDAGNNGCSLALADLTDQVTGARSDTANFTNTNNQRSFISMIAVFDLTAAGEPAAVVPLRRRIEGY